MSNDNPALPGDAPSNPEAGEPIIVESNLESKIDDFFGETPSNDIPEAIPEELDESPEVSEEEEQEDPSDDETPNVEEVEEEGTEEETDQTDESASEWNDVPYDEMKENNFRIPVKDGQTGEISWLNVDQINAEVNKSRRNDEARENWEADKAALEQREAALERDTFAIEQQRIETIGNQYIEGLKTQARDLQSKIDAAANENDSHTVSLLNAQMSKLTSQYNTANAQIEEAKQNVAQAKEQAASEAAAKLADYGYGELATDTQRKEKFREYVSAKLPPHLYGVINTSPELLAIVEQSRLYETRTATKPKTKMRGSKKTLSGGAAKSTPKSTPRDPIQGKIDKMFST